MFLEWENNSGKFQNNAINEVRKISLTHVIKERNTRYSPPDMLTILLCCYISAVVIL